MMYLYNILTLVCILRLLYIIKGPHRRTTHVLTPCNIQRSSLLFQFQEPVCQHCVTPEDNAQSSSVFLAFSFASLPLFRPRAIAWGSTVVPRCSSPRQKGEIFASLFFLSFLFLSCLSLCTLYSVRHSTLSVQRM